MIDHRQTCGAPSPTAIPKPTKLSPYQTVFVTCNRPSGHDGNHIYSTLKEARILEWTRAGKVRKR